MNVDYASLDAHRRSNQRQALALFGGLGFILGATGLCLAGWTGFIWVLVMGSIGLATSPQFSSKRILELYGARPLPLTDVPSLRDALLSLCKSAEIRNIPSLIYVPSSAPNAFSLGRRDEPVIALTDGLIAQLQVRELVAVIAHEIGHMKQEDVRIMGLGDSITRFTRLLWIVGLMGIITYPIISFLKGPSLSFLCLSLLIGAPSINALIQRGLSRSREFRADFEAVHLLGETTSLISAIMKLQPSTQALWKRILLPSQKCRDPSWIRSHPPSRERVRRLLALKLSPCGSPAQSPVFSWVSIPKTLPTPRPNARQRLSGLWF